MALIVAAIIKKKSKIFSIPLFRQVKLSSQEFQRHKPKVTFDYPKKEDSTVPIMDQETATSRIQELSEASSKYGKLEKNSTLELNDGRQMPVMALGTGLLDAAIARQIVEAAIDLGYRSIDCAFIYGTENVVGEAIKAKVDAGVVKREDLYVISKLWNTFHRPDLVEKACRESLQKLGLDYLDLYLIHYPISYKEGPDVMPRIAGVLQYSQYDYLDAWYAMEDLVKKGLVKSIGVSNFNSEQVARILEKGKIKPVINQVESHPYLNQLRLSSFCDARGVKLLCYGTLSSNGTPEPYRSPGASVLDDATVIEIAKKNNITPAQVLIRYQLEHGHGVVVKASSAKRLWENLQSQTLSLKSEDVEALEGLNKNRRFIALLG